MEMKCVDVQQDDWTQFKANPIIPPGAVSASHNWVISTAVQSSVLSVTTPILKGQIRLQMLTLPAVLVAVFKWRPQYRSTAVAETAVLEAMADVVP